MSNQTWRRKSLSLAEWSSLQEAFANLQMIAGAPDSLAMFVKSTHEPFDEVYLTGTGIEAIEARSPGGWEDAPVPSGNGLSLLVGAGDPWAYFGISKP